VLIIFLLTPTVSGSGTESPTNLAESCQLLRLPLAPLRYCESGQPPFTLWRTPSFVGCPPCWTVMVGVIWHVVGPNYLHVCMAFCRHVPAKLLLPLRAYRVNTPIRELTTTAAMCSYRMASRLSHPQVHFPKYDPFVGSFRMITIFFCVALTNHLDTAFPSLGATIHDVDCEVSVVHAIKDLPVLLFAVCGVSSLFNAHALVCCIL